MFWLGAISLFVFEVVLVGVLIAWGYGKPKAE